MSSTEEEILNHCKGKIANFKIPVTSPSSRSFPIDRQRKNHCPVMQLIRGAQVHCRRGAHGLNVIVRNREGQDRSRFLREDVPFPGLLHARRNQATPMTWAPRQLVVPRPRGSRRNHVQRPAALDRPSRCWPPAPSPRSAVPLRLRERRGLHPGGMFDCRSQKTWRSPSRCSAICNGSGPWRAEACAHSFARDWTSRRRVEAALSHHEADRVPYEPRRHRSSPAFTDAPTGLRQHLDLPKVESRLRIPSSNSRRCTKT